MSRLNVPSIAIAVVAALTLAAPTLLAQTAIPEGSAGPVERATPYSPYAQRSFPMRPMWGDTHVHTALSVDAGLAGARLRPNEAYRFARGEEVISSTGQPVKLGRPLDFLVVADHSDVMGFFDDLARGTPNVLAFEEGRRWYEGLRAGGVDAVNATNDLINVFSQGDFPMELMDQYSPGAAKFSSVWEELIDAAEEYNDPGRFTAFIGFEWSSMVGGNNLHRNVIFRDGADRARQIVPYTTAPPIGSPDPLDLYRWLDAYEEKTGGSALAIAHNGNLSNGTMFPVDAQFTGRALDRMYVEQRAKWEPLYEVTQMKGDGEAHPFLSAEDEFADYETWDMGNLDNSVPKEPDMLAREYARAGLKNGLLLEERHGTNPYKIGLVGSTDTHQGLSAVEEDNFFGKSATDEPDPQRMEHYFSQTDVGTIEGWRETSSGRAAVWAEDNSRGAIFDAMARKEVYATTGTRMTVRFFGGWDFTDDDLNSRHPAFAGYEKGVPMGGDLRGSDRSGAPSFMVFALRDPIGANLDRIQIVKGWLDGNGELQERVYDVAVSDGREIGPDGRARAAVGNTVDVANATWTNTIGAPELGAIWTDPDFDVHEAAFYYARVIEIPTPRWIAHDALRFGVDLPEGANPVHQERGYTSPIWYDPS